MTVHCFQQSNVSVIMKSCTCVVIKNNCSALGQPAFVKSTINDLIINVTEVFKVPFIINPLSLSIQKLGKKHLILDLHYVKMPIQV